MGVSKVLTLQDVGYIDPSVLTSERTAVPIGSVSPHYSFIHVQTYLSVEEEAKRNFP